MLQRTVAGTEIVFVSVDGVMAVGKVYWFTSTSFEERTHWPLLSFVSLLLLVETLQPLSTDSCRFHLAPLRS
jgi:hypothetical protein